MRPAIGTVVWWRGAWGTEPPELARVTGHGTKNGRALVHLDNGHWAYAEHVSVAPDADAAAYRAAELGEDGEVLR